MPMYVIEVRRTVGAYRTVIDETLHRIVEDNAQDAVEGGE